MLCPSRKPVTESILDFAVEHFTTMQIRSENINFIRSRVSIFQFALEHPGPKQRSMLRELNRLVKNLLNNVTLECIDRQYVTTVIRQLGDFYMYRMPHMFPGSGNCSAVVTNANRSKFGSEKQGSDSLNEYLARWIKIEYEAKVLQVHWSKDEKLLKFCELLVPEYRIYADSVNAGNLADMIADMRRWEEKYVIREGRRPNASAVMKPSKVSVKAVSSGEPTRHKSTKPCYHFQKDEC
jgi:hypothetical protein